MVFKLIFIFSFLISKECHLKINVNVDEPHGDLYLAVFDRSDSFMDKAVYSIIEKINSNQVVLDILLEDGDYAISIFQDLNGNGELDTNFIGIPTEPYGFSNNARGRFGPPNYEDCVFNLSGNKEVTIDL